jgi:hypothetical protein
MKNLLISITIMLFLGCASKVETVIPEVHEIEDIQTSPFTINTIKEYNLVEADLLHLQYYTSHDIILNRQVFEYTSAITNGSLVIDETNRKNEIIIKAGTPCVALQSGENYIVVSFDNGYELTFMRSNKKCCKDKSLYYLSANRWQNGIGLIHTNGEEFHAVGTSGKSHLMINKKSLEDSTDNSVVIKGKRITQSLNMHEI